MRQQPANRTATLEAMHAKLEHCDYRIWWKVLLAPPPRRLSEFGTYRRFLSVMQTEHALGLRPNARMAVISDASTPEKTRHRVSRMHTNSETHYITVHSQSSGRQHWRTDGYAPLLRPLVQGSSA